VRGLSARALAAAALAADVNHQAVQDD